MTRIGIVTGTRREAACLAPHRVACSGADAARARAAALELLAAGCEALASVGTAGGLHPDLAPGTVVIAAEVTGGGRFETHAGWREALAAALAAGGVAARLAAVAGSDEAVLHVETKRRLFAATGALCVDMESHIVAAVAAEAGVPFLAVRAVADPADRVLPRAALAAVGPDGELRVAALLAALAARPGEIGGMAGLARDSRRALGALRRVAAVGGPTLSLLLPLP